MKAWGTKPSPKRMDRAPPLRHRHPSFSTSSHRSPASKVHYRLHSSLNPHRVFHSTGPAPNFGASAPITPPKQRISVPKRAGPANISQHTQPITSPVTRQEQGDDSSFRMKDAPGP
ncbi:hypothetical protein CC80DRAFT_255453 [Byssothecium circinans]|uniref:Uncharacterized protein n=1 Tax=Byssothecium circinans TaxID=147558 RepID=A0A6A5T9D2_9PLEO|nr:hypothetical protein CC80DRAFT_255453 [Byssothecium circinans]